MNKAPNSRNSPKIRIDGFVNKWNTKVVGDILKIKSGMSQKGIESPNGVYPILATGGEIGRTDIALYSRESVLIGRKGTIDKPYYMNSPFWTVDTLFYSELFKDVDGRFVYTLFQRIPWRKFDTSTGVPSLTSTAIHSISISIPQIKEQKAIGELFQTLDQTLTLKRQKHDKTKTLKKALLSKLFPQAGQSQPEMRLKGFSGDWVEYKLSQLTEVTSVKRIHQSDWTDSGIPFYRARDIVALSKGINAIDKLFITKEKYEEYSSISGKVKVGDLLVTGVGSIGIPYLINSNRPLYFKDGNIIWFKNSTIVGGFLYYSFISNYIQDFIKSEAGIGTVGTYTINSGKNTPILLPTDEKEQTAIANILKTLDETITLRAKKIKTLENLKKALLAKMFV